MTFATEKRTQSPTLTMWKLARSNTIPKIRGASTRPNGSSHNSSLNTLPHQIKQPLRRAGTSHDNSYKGVDIIHSLDTHTASSCTATTDALHQRVLDTLVKYNKLSRSTDRVKPDDLSDHHGYHDRHHGYNERHSEHNHGYHDSRQYDMHGYHTRSNHDVSIIITNGQITMLVLISHYVTKCVEIQLCIN